eukprot:scaffold115657_cov28-Tisochrysis_lutea.AAC.5
MLPMVVAAQSKGSPAQVEALNGRHSGGWVWLGKWAPRSTRSSKTRLVQGRIAHTQWCPSMCALDAA